MHNDNALKVLFVAICQLSSFNECYQAYLLPRVWVCVWVDHTVCHEVYTQLSYELTRMQTDMGFPFRRFPSLSTLTNILLNIYRCLYIFQLLKVIRKREKEIQFVYAKQTILRKLSLFSLNLNIPIIYVFFLSNLFWKTIMGHSTPNRTVWKILIFDSLHFLTFFSTHQKTLPGKFRNFFDHWFKRYRISVFRS